MDLVPLSAEQIGAHIMRVIYNSPHFCVLEFPQAIALRESHAPEFRGGFEILDKAAKREIFLAGNMAEGFREHLREWAQTPPSFEEVDDYLMRFQGLAQQPLILH
jgi:hypothetical protein